MNKPTPPVPRKPVVDPELVQLAVHCIADLTTWVDDEKLLSKAACAVPKRGDDEPRAMYEIRLHLRTKALAAELLVAAVNGLGARL